MSSLNNLINSLNLLFTSSIEIEEQLRVNGALSAKQQLKLQEIQESISLTAIQIQTDIQEGTLLDKNTLSLSLDLCSEINKKCSSLILTSMYGAKLSSQIPEKSDNKKSCVLQEPFSPIKKQVAKRLFPQYGKKERQTSLEKQIFALEKRVIDLKKNIADLETKFLNSSNLEGTIKKQLIIEKNKNVHELAEIDKKISSLKLKYSKIKKNQKKGEETRQLFQTLCGEHVQLITKDLATVDGCFLDVEKFRKHLKEAGGEFVTLERNLPNGQKEVIKGIKFNKENYKNHPNHVIQILKKLNAIGNYKINDIRCGSGWIIVNDYENKNVFLCSDTHIEDIMNLKNDSQRLIQFNKTTGEFYIQPDFAGSVTTTKIESIDLNKNSLGGTVIITSGRVGVYEMHKQEALYFLFKGMNVFLFNFRGHGESKGIPTEEGLNIDYETACEYVIKRAHIDESRILIKAICLSGGAAAHAAKRFPKAHIFIDQTFSDFHLLAQDQIAEMINGTIPEKTAHVIGAAASQIGRPILPTWNVSADLIENQGNKLILISDNDRLISKKHLTTTMKQLYQKNGATHVTVFSISGTHGTNWVNSRDCSLKNTPEWKGAQNKIEHLRNKKEKIDADAKTILELAEQKVLKMETQIADNLKLPIDESKAAIAKNLQGQVNEMRLQIRKKEEQLSEKSAKYALKIKEIEDNLKKGIDERLARFNYTARQQVDCFLIRAGLSDDIIDVKDKKRIVKDPIFVELQENINYVVNLIEKMELIANLFKPILNRVVNRLEVDSNCHYFFCFDENRRIVKVKISNQNIEQLKELIKELPKLKAIHSEIVYRHPERHIQGKIIHCENKLIEMCEILDQEYLKINKAFIDRLNDEKKQFVDSIQNELRLAEHLISKLKKNELLCEQNIKQISIVEEELLKSIKTIENLIDNKEYFLMKFCKDLNTLHTLSLEEKRKLEEDIFKSFSEIHNKLFSARNRLVTNQTHFSFISDINNQLQAFESVEREALNFTKPFDILNKIQKDLKELTFIKLKLEELFSVQIFTKEERVHLYEFFSEKIANTKYRFLELRDKIEERL